MRILNTPDIVAEIIDRLGRLGVDCLLFGGWAEEALGLRQPGPHADIDLLLNAMSFQILDDILAAESDDLEEIPLKRFAHKRSFLLNGLMVEVVLVQQEGETVCTWFWGDVPFEWLTPLAEPGVLRGHQLMITSKENLKRYRTCHRSTEPWRWKDRRMVLYTKER